MKDNVTTIYRGIVLMFLGYLVATFTTINVTTSVRLDQFEQKVISNIDSLRKQIDTLNMIHPYQKVGKKKISSRTVCKSGTFLGFLVRSKIDTNLSDKLYNALYVYNGPKVSIGSARRHSNHKSDHYTGNAIDLEFDHELIEFLVSADGQKWLSSFGLYFFIEGKPGSSKVRKYEEFQDTSKYVFYNPRATGDQIHLGVV